MARSSIDNLREKVQQRHFDGALDYASRNKSKQSIDFSRQETRQMVDDICNHFTVDGVSEDPNKALKMIRIKQWCRDADWLQYFGDDHFDASLHKLALTCYKAAKQVGTGEQLETIKTTLIERAEELAETLPLTAYDFYQEADSHYLMQHDVEASNLAEKVEGYFAVLAEDIHNLNPKDFNASRLGKLSGILSEIGRPKIVFEHTIKWLESRWQQEQSTLLQNPQIMTTMSWSKPLAEWYTTLLNMTTSQQYALMPEQYAYMGTFFESIGRRNSATQAFYRAGETENQYHNILRLLDGTEQEIDRAIVGVPMLLEDKDIDTEVLQQAVGTALLRTRAVFPKPYNGKVKETELKYQTRLTTVQQRMQKLQTVRSQIIAAQR